MKKHATTIVVGAVFAALAAFLYFGQPKTREEIEEDALTLVSVDREKLAKVVITNASGTITLEKKDGGEWRVTSPRDLPAEESSLNQVKNALEGLMASDPVWENAGDEERKKAGFDTPAATVVWKSDDGKEGTLEVGRELPKNEVYYVASSGKPGIYTARKWNVEVFTKALDGFRRRKILGDLDRDSVLTILLEVPGREPLMLTRTDAVLPWYVQTPFEGRADRGKANGLLTRLANLRAEEFVDPAPTEKGLDGLRGTISVTATGGKSWTLLVGKDVAKPGVPAPLFYVRDGESGQVALAAGPLPADLAEPFNAWRDKALFDFFADDVSVVDLVLDKGTITLARNDGRMFATTAGTPVLAHSEANEFLRSTRDATVLEVGPAAPAGSAKSKELGLESPVLRARWTALDVTHELVIGNAKPGKTQRWVRTHESPSALLVDADPIVKAFTALAVKASALPATPAPAPSSAPTAPPG